MLGIEYAPAELAEPFRGAGVSLAKPYPDFGQWKTVQPKAGGAYDWRQVDTFVKAYQRAGFGEFNLMISARSDWANVDPPNPPVHRGGSALKPEYEDDFAAYVQAYVERYDGDGVADMPGLARPILLYGFEPEFSSYVPGTAADYLHLLELVHPSVKKANPHAKIMTAGLLMAYVFDGYPSTAEVDRRLANAHPKIFDKSPADIGRLLDRPELFDIVDFHSLVDYTEIIPTVTWLRAQMAKRGYDKPIWIGDTWGGATLNAYGPATCPVGPIKGILGYPAAEADRCRVGTALTALAQTASPKHAEAIAWIRAESAAGIVRKVVVAAGAGLAGINMGNVEDFEPLMLTLGGAGTSPWQGMLDRTFATRAFRGYRPAFYALKQVASVVAAYRNVSRIDLKDPRLYAYEFELNGGDKVIVAWADNGIWLPGDKVPLREVSLPIDWTGPVTVESTITQGATPTRQSLAPQGAALSIPLGPIPVFLSQG